MELSLTGTVIAEQLPDKVEKSVVFTRDREGLRTEPLDSFVLFQAEELGYMDDDVRLATAEQNLSTLRDVLGIRTETHERFTVTIEGKERDLVSENPQVATTWVGPYVELFTPEEAARREYAGSNALAWAQSYMQKGQIPEMVVRAKDGYFYPASIKDTVVKVDK